MSLRVHAAGILPQWRKISCCQAAGIAAIHEMRSKSETMNSQVADKAAFCSRGYC
jgi:hypothetical protein